jgi:hypothetical protein
MEGMLDCPQDGSPAEAILTLKSAITVSAHAPFDCHPTHARSIDCETLLRADGRNYLDQFEKTCTIHALGLRQTTCAASSFASVLPNMARHILQFANHMLACLLGLGDATS